MIRGFRCKYDIDKYCESDKCDKCKNHLMYKQGRADAIEEFAKPVINGTLHIICRMIASGDIPKDIYQKWLSKTPIGFMTPLEIYSELMKEQLKDENNE